MDFINSILFWTLCSLLIWQAYILVFNLGVPNIQTAPAIRKKLVALIDTFAKDNNIQKLTIIEVGSGKGKVSRLFAKCFPKALIVSYEISKFAYRHCIFLANYKRLKNVSYKNEDFFTAPLPKADVIYFYFIGYQMEEMGQKLKKEGRKNTLVISNRFALGAGLKPDKIIDVKTLYPHQKTLYVYTL